MRHTYVVTWIFYSPYEYTWHLEEHIFDHAGINWVRPFIVLHQLFPFHLWRTIHCAVPRNSVLQMSFCLHYTDQRKWRHLMSKREGRPRAAAQVAEWLAAAWNGPPRHMMPWPACAFVRAAHGHAKALRTWPLKWRVFTSRWRMWARPAGGIAEDASTHAMTTGLAFPIVCPPALGVTSLRWHQQHYITTMGTDNSSVECPCTPSQTPSCPEKPQ